MNKVNLEERNSNEDVLTLARALVTVIRKLERPTPALTRFTEDLDIEIRTGSVLVRTLDRVLLLVNSL